MKGLLFITSFTLLFLSCSQQMNEEVAKSITYNAVENKDSVNTILKEINAESKSVLLDAFFKRLYNKSGFNGTVLVAQRGQIIFKNAYGFFNREKKEPLEVKSVFQLASVSKQFTAMGILMLLEEGKLKLEDDVKKHIPNFPYDGITIHLLLCHRSGLPDYRYFCDESYCCKREAISNDKVIDLMKELKPGIYYKPDKHFDYNNTNYMLLATIIEKLSGYSYAEFMQRRIFTPLNMSSTFVCDKIENPKNVALGYSAGWRRLWNDYQNGVVGDKNIYSNVEDMQKWDKALYTERLIKQPTMQLAYQPYSKELKTRNYGFGYRLKTLENGDSIVFHGGWWRGYNNLYYRRLKDQTSIIVLSNRVNFCFNNLEDVWNILDEKETKVAL